MLQPCACVKTETENLTLCGKHHWKLESISENTLFLMLDAPYYEIQKGLLILTYNFKILDL